MPVAFIDVPPGLTINAKQKLVTEVTTALHHAYVIPDNRVFLREWSADQVGIDGRLGAPLRPICHFVVPPGLATEGKRQLVRRVSAAVAEACTLPTEEVPLPSGTTVSTTWVLGFFNEYPLDRASLDDVLAFENPMVLESMEAAMQMANKPG